MRPMGGLLLGLTTLIGLPAVAAAQTATTPALSESRALFTVAFQAGSGPEGLGGEPAFVWRDREVSVAVPSSASSVDVLRIAVAEAGRVSQGALLNRPDGLSAVDASTFDVSFTRHWPAAVSWSRGGYDLDVTPHAGIGLTSAGQSAEAGAMVRIGANLKDRVISGLNGLGVQSVDRRAFAERGRWFLFAAASGRSVGYNMMGAGPADPRRIAWTAEQASSLVSDAQVGVGWRKGDMQASFGYVHREIKPQFATALTDGPGQVSGSMVAVSFSLRGR